MSSTSSDVSDCTSLVITELRIVLLGKTGSGKSDTGNAILGKKAFYSEISPSSVTKTCKRKIGNFDGRSVSVVDTPGMFDTSCKEDKLKSEIEKCVMLSVPGPHIFLLVIKLNTRFTEEEKTSVKWIKDNFGEEASKYTLVLFTRGDELKGITIEAYLRKSPELRQFISSHTAGYVVFDNTCKADRTQVADLFEKIDKMVKVNGNHYTSVMYEEAQKKIKSQEWWSKWGGYMNAAGDQMLLTAALAAPALGAVPLAQKKIATAVGAALVTGAGVTKAIGKWGTPKVDN